MKADPKLGVLVVDDSAYNRRAISDLLRAAEGIHVLDTACDAEEGLRKATQLKPDVITLDLEMPGLDGFAFLRLLRASLPTPVIVLSSYAHRSDVFKALELGAFDFVAKPRRRGGEDLEAVREELVQKIRAVRLARPAPRRRSGPKEALGSSLIVGVGASTGGPPAIQRIIESLSGEGALTLLIAQHMPAKFTHAFAERLDRIGAHTVQEGRDGDPVLPGHAYVAPGGKQMLVVRRQRALHLKVRGPIQQEKHAPSVDVLFKSLAEAAADRALGVVLTGMGADGAEGARALHRAGAEVWAESERTAVIFGMPQEAIGTGTCRRVLPLDEIGPALALLARRRSLAR